MPTSLDDTTRKISMSGLSRELIAGLTQKDVDAAKRKRGAVSTLDFVLKQVGKYRTLDQAKAHLVSILEKAEG